MKLKVDSTGSEVIDAVPENEKAAILNLLRADEIGSATVRKLLETFGDAQSCLTADDSTLENVGRLSRDSIESLRNAQANNFGEKQLEQATRLGVRVLCPDDEEYPTLLKEIYNPPSVLFVLGKPIPTGHNFIAVVGSRNASEPGIEIAHQLGAGLHKADVYSVSGMALGIDGATHRGSLQEGGKTIAVLGCGVDKVYPSKHRNLYNEIVQKGTVISELFLGSAPESKNFPMRNRIIAGMSSGTVVVEAAEKSGSLITASYALNENRQVFAVPGHPFSKKHTGCNFLLRQGATLIRHAGDLLEDLTPVLDLVKVGKNQGQLPFEPEMELDKEELRVYNELDVMESKHADILSEQLKMDTSRLGAILLLLEMKGVVQRLPGDNYRKFAYNG